MARKNKKICKLCSKTIYGNNYKTLEGDNRQILEVLLLQVDIKPKEDCVMCNYCLDIVQKCFEFKTNCLYVEDYISPFIVKGFKIDLGGVLQKKVEINPNDVKLCRLCIDIIEDNKCKHLDRIGNQDLLEDIRNCLPELNINAVCDPLICLKCINCINEFSTLQQKCRDPNSVSKSKQCRKLDLNSNVKTENIKLDFGGNSCNLEDNGNKQRNNDFTMKEIKVEEISNADSTEYIKSEEIDIKPEPLKAVGASSYLREMQNEFNKEGDFKYKNPLTQMYVCPTCKFETKTKNNLLRHMLRHLDPSKNEPFKCGMCDYTTYHKERLKYHFFTHKDSSETVTYTCRECDFKTNYRGSFIKHKSEHADRLVNVHKCALTKTYRCATCNYESKDKHCFIRHLTRHVDPSKKEMFKCNLCEYVTDRKDTLKSHSFIHKDLSQVVIYKCKDCGFSTRWKDGFKRHRSNHMKQQIDIHKCTHCKFTTKNIKDLKKHELKHLDISKNEFKCELCDYKADTATKVQSHTCAHKNVTSRKKLGRKPNKNILCDYEIGADGVQKKIYKCEVCDYKTRWISALKKHGLVHTDWSEAHVYICDHCEFKTKYRSTLKNHLANHNNPARKKLKCPNCNYTTKYEQTLEIHSLQHVHKK